MTIADRIRDYRESNFITQDELAKKMGYKDRSNISKIEASGNDISLRKISKVAEALGVSEAYLMGWEEVDIPKKEVTSSIRSLFGGDKKIEELISIYSSLDEDGKKLLLSMARRMI